MINNETLMIIILHVNDTVKSKISKLSNLKTSENFENYLVHILHL